MIQKYQNLIKSTFGGFRGLAILLSIWTTAGWAQTATQPNYTLKNPETGTTKSYLAWDFVTMKPGFRFAAAPGSSFNAKIQAGIPPKPTSNTYAKPDGTITTNPAEGGIVGSIPGRFNVGSSGAASYSIPIECTAGINGMQPNISLEYNSQGGDGPLGVGWGIGGLSSITSAMQTIFSDNAIGGIDKYNDTYAMDGNKLIVKNNVTPNIAHYVHTINAYVIPDEYEDYFSSFYPNWGTDTGSTYETENKSYTKIETFGFIPNIIISYPNSTTTSWKVFSTSPRYFKVTTKDGRIIEYVPSKNSYLITSDADVSYEWLISKITDTNGNFMTFTYQSSDGQSVIKEIEYTGNGDKLPFNKITFDYETKTTVKRTYYNNIFNEDKFLLRSIKLISNGTTLKQYDLNYAVRKEKNYLEEVKLTGLNSQKLNSTIFAWGEDNDNISVTTSTTPEPYSDQPVSKSDRYWLSADTNGDGIDEVINIYPAQIAVPNGGTYLTKDYIQVFKPTVVGGEISLTNDVHYDIGAGLSYENIKSLNPSVLIGDINGDGKKELIIPKLDLTNGAKVKFQVAGGNTYERPLLYSTQLPVCAVADINNDGIDEIIYLEKGKNSDPNSEYVFGEVCYTKSDNSKIWTPITTKLGIGQTAIPAGIKMVDFNNDGLQDLIVIDGGNVKYSNSGNPANTFDYNPVGFSFEGYFNELSGSYKTNEEGDFDGDGSVDFLTHNPNSSQNGKSWCVHLNNGTVFSSILEDGGGSSNIVENIDCIVMDFNNDGKSDVILANRIKNSSNIYVQTIVTWYTSTGTGFAIAKTFTNTDFDYSFRKYNCTGDFDGDGRQDVLSYGSDIYNGGNKSDNVFIQRAFDTNFEANRIKTITNGLGKKTEISYQPLTHSTTPDNKPFYTKGTGSVYPVADVQMPIYCVSKVSEPNGSSGLNTTEFSYSEARVQLTGRGFLGFKTQTINNATTNRKIVSTTDMNLAYCLPNSTTTEVWAGGTVASTNVSSYTNSKADKIFLSQPLQTVEHDYLNDLSKTTDYLNINTDGNLTSLKTTQGDLITTQTIGYVQKGSFCPNKVSSISVTRQQGTDIHTRLKSYTYDDKGNMTKEITDVGDANQLTVEYPEEQRNQFGQPTKIMTTANGITRSATISTDGRFVNSKTDVLGQTTTYEWNTTTGLLDSETNRLGTTGYIYNDMGQLIRTNYPDGTYKESTAQWASPDNAYGAKFYVYQTTSGTAPTFSWFDALQRPVVQEEYGLNGKKSRVFTQYRTDGKTEKVSAPTFGSEPTAWDAVYDYYTEGRLKTVVTPIGTSTNTYDGRTTTVSSPEGTQTSVLNFAGQVQTSTVNGKTVTYAYYASGQAKTVTPDGGTAVAMEYDLQGNRIKLTDPDPGITTAYYNGLGEMKWEKLTNTAAQGEITTTYNYNATTGLMESRVRNGEITTYGYDTNKRLETVEIAGQHKQTYTYGAYDRVSTLTELIDGTKTLVKELGYDDYGRVNKETFPSGYYVENHYDNYGNLYKITDSKTPTRVIWQATEANARGQLTKLLKGAKESVYGYDEAKGQLTSMVAPDVVNYSYSYDAKNNLAYRSDNLIGQKEHFTYDTQNRLTNWDIMNSSTNAVLAQNSITYDPTTGNITGKSDLNIPNAVKFNYDKASNPHALTTITGQQVGQAGNPDAISDDELAVTYTDFRKIKTLNEGGKNYVITYGVDDQRRKSEYTINGTTTTRYYFGNYEEETIGSNVREIHYLSGAIYIDNSIYNDSLYYTYTDNQGSVIALTDESGNVKREYAYDPWGARRDAANWTQKDNGSNLIINRGYTGHEHLDAFGIINMNGRVYDPLTAMFFSPDPFIQSAGDWKNYNRYSYCMNNPTRYTDPSGYILCNSEMPVMTDNYYHLNGIDAFGSGGSGGGFNVSKPFGGKTGNISYDWVAHNNGSPGVYRDAQGNEVSFSETMRNQNIDVPATLALGFKIAKLQGWAGNYDDFTTLYGQRTASNSYNGTFTLHTFEWFDVPYGIGSRATGSIELILAKGLKTEDEQLLINLQYGASGISSTVLFGKGLLIRHLANDFVAGGNVTEITTAAAKLNKIAKPFKIAGSVLGVYSAYQHGEKVYNAYNNGDWGSVAINGGKLALDVLFMTSKCVNPVFLGASIAYGVVDYMTNDY